MIDWEKEFEEQFPGNELEIDENGKVHLAGRDKEVKAFIRKTLEEQAQRYEDRLRNQRKIVLHHIEQEKRLRLSEEEVVKCLHKVVLNKDHLKWRYSNTFSLTVNDVRKVVAKAIYELQKDKE